MMQLLLECGRRLARRAGANRNVPEAARTISAPDPARRPRRRGFALPQERRRAERQNRRMAFFLSRLAPALALMLLGAHFARTGTWIAVALCAGAIALLVVQRTWAVRVVQATLALGTVEWLRTAFLLVQERLALGRPWMRLALILLALTAFTAFSAWVVRRVRRRGPHATS